MHAGTRIYSIAYDTAQEAYAAAMRMRDEASNPVAGETLEHACEAAIDEARQKRTAGTRRWYQDHLRAIQRLIPGDTPLAAITAETVEQFVRDRMRAGTRRVTASTVNADLRALHRVFALAIRRGVARDNPVRRVDRPRADAPAMDWFAEPELRELLARFDDQTRDVLLLFALTGVRRSEAARLEIGHVRLKLAQLVVPGKRGTRVVPLAPDADAPLRRLLAAAGAGPALLPGGTHAIDDLFRAARKTCGDRRLHAHALRHTFGTALVRAGVRPDVVMRLMGHRSLQTTLRYVHEVGEDGIRAVQSLRLVQPDESARGQGG